MSGVAEFTLTSFKSLSMFNVGHVVYYYLRASCLRLDAQVVNAVGEQYHRRIRAIQ